MSCEQCEPAPRRGAGGDNAHSGGTQSRMRAFVLRRRTLANKRRYKHQASGSVRGTTSTRSTSHTSSSSSLHRHEVSAASNAPLVSTRRNPGLAARPVPRVSADVPQASSASRLHQRTRLLSQGRRRRPTRRRRRRARHGDSADAEARLWPHRAGRPRRPR